MYWHLNWITNFWKFSSPVCESYWMFRNIANLKTKYGNKHVATISIRRKTYKSVHGRSFITVEQQRITLLNLWRYEQMKGEIYVWKVFIFFNSPGLENFKIHCLRTFRFFVCGILYCRAFVERSSVRQTVNLGIFKPWRVEKMNTFQTYISPFNFELSLIFEKSVPWSSRGWQS